MTDEQPEIDIDNPEVVDLTANSDERAAGLVSTLYARPGEKDTLAQQRYRVARYLLWILVMVVAGQFVITGIACGAGAATKADIDAIRASLDPTLTAIVGLVGAATGFYFGDRSATR